jgi:hypothetical protein
MYIKTEDPDLPAFYYDPLIHPIPFYKADARGSAKGGEGGEGGDDDDIEGWALPVGWGCFGGLVWGSGVWFAVLVGWGRGWSYLAAGTPPSFLSWLGNEGASVSKASGR